MNTISKLTALTLLIALIFTGCEKDPLQPDKNALRISKVSQTIGMEYPELIFDYNDEGLLIAVIDNNGNPTVSITYNEDNLPISIFRERSEIDYTIEYDENGYTVSWYESGGEGDKSKRYETDSDGRLIDGDEGEAQWITNDSLVILGYGGIKFDKEHPHPYSSIPLPVINVLELRLSQGDFRYSNNYCPVRFDYVEGHYHEGDYYSFDYEYNEEGYPIRSNGRYGDAEDGVYRTDTYFFEYETD